MRRDYRAGLVVFLSLTVFGTLAGCGGGGGGGSGNKDAGDGGTDSGGGDSAADATNAPSVTFVTPASGQNLCGAGSSSITGCVADTNATTAGWQGTLAVHVTAGGAPVSGVTVTFTIGTTVLGMATLDANGDAQLSGASIPDGTSVTITATTADVPGHGVGVGTITVVVDTTAPTVAPTGLSAAVADRRQTSFQLSWINSPEAAKGYQIRAAKVAITAANFDAVGTTVINYTGTPAAANAADGFLVKNLSIETGYYFAIAATDAGGNRSPIVATAAATTASFLATTLTGQATTDHIGYSVDGTGDLGTAGSGAFAADGLSDLLVGNFSLANGATANTAKVYIYFGAAGGYASAPSVTITSAVNGFGTAVVDAGDVDGDGLDDLAISSPSDGAGKVFIFSRKSPTWSTTSTWPATLTDTQANYVITADATYTGRFFGQKMAAARSFEGGTTSDLVIGTPGYNGNAGQTLIAKGGASFGSLTLPSATATLVINGNAANDLLGSGLTDIGYFDNSTQTWLAASSTGAGSVFAFQSQALAAVNAVGVSTDSAVYTPVTSRYGNPMSFIGSVGGSTAAVAVGAIGFFVDVHLGTTASGPFGGTAGSAPAPSVRFVDPAAGNSWGVVTLGGGIPAVTQSLSLVGGDPVGDLVMAGQAEAGTPLYIVSGNDLATLTGMVDVTTEAKVIKVANRLPAGWVGYAGSSVGRDSNGDGYSDIVLGEFTSTATGRVVVLY